MQIIYMFESIQFSFFFFLGGGGGGGGGTESISSPEKICFIMCPLLRNEEYVNSIKLHSVVGCNPPGHSPGPFVGQNKVSLLKANMKK